MQIISMIPSGHTGMRPCAVVETNGVLRIATERSKISMMRSPRTTRRGGGLQAFTLIELLVVISVISILAALIFPSFFSAREKGRSAACLSNLHQLGLAMSIYMEDNDGIYPWGADPSDKNTII